MNAINILLVVIILYVLYMIVVNNKETFIQTQNEPNNLINDVVSYDDVITDISYDSGDSSSNYSSDYVLQKHKLNPNFVDIQFHTDYRHVIAAINNLVPSFKQIFNIPNIPIKYSELNDFNDKEKREVMRIVRDFMNVLNENIANQVSAFRQSNTGWDEVLPEPEIKSGWDKAQEALGLAPSLYNKPAGKAPVNLIDIRKVQKYETDDETKFTMELVIQKINVSDQMVIQPSFVVDKRALRDENNFNINTNINLTLIIESIYILGYLSKQGIDSRLVPNDTNELYNFSNMEQNDLTDPRYVQKILLDKYKQRTQAMLQRDGMLDEEGQEFHRTLPKVYEYPNIRATQTIFDDMNSHRIFE